ncbi:MAG: hypothetical protein WC775_04800 [Patescibacteria group bacterium]|jgi:hypothetical protein
MADTKPVQNDAERSEYLTARGRAVAAAMQKSPLDVFRKAPDKEIIAMNKQIREQLIAAVTKVGSETERFFTTRRGEMQSTVNSRMEALDNLVKDLQATPELQAELFDPAKHHEIEKRIRFMLAENDPGKKQRYQALNIPEFTDPLRGADYNLLAETLGQTQEYYARANREKYLALEQKVRQKKADKNDPLDKLLEKQRVDFVVAHRDRMNSKDPKDAASKPLRSIYLDNRLLQRLLKEAIQKRQEGENLTAAVATMYAGARGLTEMNQDQVVLINDLVNRWEMHELKSKEAEKSHESQVTSQESMRRGEVTSPVVNIPSSSTPPPTPVSPSFGAGSWTKEQMRADAQKRQQRAVNNYQDAFRRILDTIPTPSPQRFVTRLVPQAVSNVAEAGYNSFMSPGGSMSSTFNNIRSAANTAKNAVDTAKKISSAVKAAGVLGNPVVLTIIIAGAIVLLFLMIIQSNNSTTAAQPHAVQQNGPTHGPMPTDIPPVQTTPGPTIPPVQGPPIEQIPTTLQAVITTAAQAACIPSEMLAAISSHEASGTWRMNETDFNFYNTPGWWTQGITKVQACRGYDYNTCTNAILIDTVGLQGQYCGRGPIQLPCYPNAVVSGPMQFEAATWGAFRGRVEAATGRTADQRVISDAFMGAAFKIKSDSRNTATTSCTQWTSTTWSLTDFQKASQGYMGGTGHPCIDTSTGTTHNVCGEFCDLYNERVVQNSGMSSPQKLNCEYFWTTYGRP